MEVTKSESKDKEMRAKQFLHKVKSEIQNLYNDRATLKAQLNEKESSKYCL